MYHTYKYKPVSTMLSAIARSTEKILRRSYTHLNNNQKILLSTFAVHNTSKYKSKIEERISMLGHQLPSASTPAGSYISCVRSGNMIYTAGHLPFDVNGELITGKVGKDVTEEEAAHAAEMVTLGILATLKNEISNLDDIKRIVKVTGFVAAVDNFEKHPTVLNGCSNLLGDIFEERGVHSRSAVGVYTLPLNACVEIEAIVEV